MARASAGQPDYSLAMATEELLGTALRNGRYAVSGVLGHGSQGSTFEAVDKLEGRLVAIKRFQVRGARSWKDVELAEREAQVLGGLSHRLLPKVIDHFEEDGALYLVMEKVEGKTLGERVLSREEVIRYLQDASELLDYLHSRSPPVIHRDIKPQNVILRPPRAELGETHASHVLVDFGSVRAHLAPRGGSTVVGTFGYMAPEQLQGRALRATDVYAVGVTALRLLTGIEPEDLPHRGLGIHVPSALGEHDTPLVRALSAMVDPDPEKRASRIAPLLTQFHAAQPTSEPRHKVRRRKKRRRERREERARRRDWERVEAWPPLGRAIAVLGLSIANLAVSVALRFFVPMLLSMMSLVFGAALRRAANAVDGAGRRAQLTIGRARRRVQGRAPVRIQQGKARIVNEDPIDEALAEMEQAADEFSEELDKRIRRRGGPP